jgi:acyl-CoA dehydrogenase
LFTVMARTGAEGSGADGISAFLVPAATPGLAVGAPDRKMGQRGAHTADVVLTDCRVPSDSLLGREGEGFRIAMRVLDKGRLHIAALCTAMAERMLEDALRYALDRRQFGQRIAEFQLVQAMLADSRTECLAARSMVVETARRRDADEDVGLDASCCKLFASEMCGRVADRAVQIFGGAGYIEDYGIERFYRDARLFRIYEGTSQIQQLVIARGMIRRAQAE